MSLEFQPGSMDAVVALYSVIHLPREEQKVIIGRIGEWVKDGGYLVINLGGDENPGTFENGWLGGDDMFWSAFDGKTCRELVEGAGFDLLEAEIKQDLKDAPFLWIFARKGAGVKRTS